MRAPTILIALMSVMVVVFAGVALAKVINGDDNDNRLRGTDKADTIKGEGGDDWIAGFEGDDTIIPGSGEDEVHAGQGDDFINAVDRSKDSINCGVMGAGSPKDAHDRVRANPGDVLSGRETGHGCEKVIREGIRVN